jgi:hypothetical protein
MSANSTLVKSPEQPQVEFRDIPDYLGYRVGDDGSLWSRWERGGEKGSSRGAHHLSNSWKQLHPAPNRDGYLTTALRTNKAAR